MIGRHFQTDSEQTLWGKYDKLRPVTTGLLGTSTGLLGTSKPVEKNSQKQENVVKWRSMEAVREAELWPPVLGRTPGWLPVPHPQKRGSWRGDKSVHAKEDMSTHMHVHTHERDRERERAWRYKVWHRTGSSVPLCMCTRGQVSLWNVCSIRWPLLTVDSSCQAAAPGPCMVRQVIFTSKETEGNPVIMMWWSPSIVDMMMIIISLFCRKV